jgi:AFG3 family protein
MSENKNNQNKKMSNNIPPLGDDPQGKKNKFNIYWLWAIVAITIFMVSLFQQRYPNGIETDSLKFYEILRNGDVDQIKTIRNKDMVRIFINRDSFSQKSDFYKGLLNTSEEKKRYETAVRANPPQLFFTIIDDRTFAEDLREFYKENPEVRQIPNIADNEGEWFVSLINTLLPILLIALVFIMMMRKVGGAGAGGGPGGIFSIGKSKATLFERGTKVNINFGDVAGLDEAKVEVM